MNIKILGQYDTDGQYNAFVTPQDAVLFGSTLRDSDGFVVAVKDDYGDWVSPTLHRLGIKSKLKIEEPTP